jgi:hypothetical protein
MSGRTVEESTSVDKLICRHCAASASRVFSASPATRTASLPINRCAGRLSLAARRRAADFSSYWVSLGWPVGRARRTVLLIFGPSMIALLLALHTTSYYLPWDCSPMRRLLMRPAPLCSRACRQTYFTLARWERLAAPGVRSFEHDARLKDLLAKQAQLNACLDLDKHEAQIVDEPPEGDGLPSPTRMGAKPASPAPFSPARRSDPMPH